MGSGSHAYSGTIAASRTRSATAPPAKLPLIFLGSAEHNMNRASGARFVTVLAPCGVTAGGGAEPSAAQ